MPVMVTGTVLADAFAAMVNWTIAISPEPIGLTPPRTKKRAPSATGLPAAVLPASLCCRNLLQLHCRLSRKKTSDQTAGGLRLSILE